jgi:16S rRNA (cytidine1402-2'-O)-methyltransferase
VGTLFIVGTPIGNLEDISLRALRVLREVRLIAAEDTRHSRRLLQHYGIKTPLTSYFEHNKLTKLEQVLAALAEGDVALVSDAGMPGISDPGYELVAAALERGITVVPVPGPAAAILALAASGLPSDQFVYLGFIPRRGSERRRFLADVAGEPRTLIAYEAPHRILECLKDVLATLGNRRLAVARELTKLHEEVRRGTVEEALAHFSATPPRGEFTLVIAGRPREVAQADPQAAQRRLQELRQEGASGREAVALVVAETGLPKREVYRLWLALDERS